MLGYTVNQGIPSFSGDFSGGLYNHLEGHNFSSHISRINIYIYTHTNMTHQFLVNYSTVR